MEHLINIINTLNAYSNLLLLIVALVSAIIAIRQWKDQRSDSELKIASGLTAWWASNHCDKPWGVVISNTSNLTFYNVNIQTSGNFNDQAEPIHLDAVPPGHFFIEGLPESDTFNWGFADEIKDFYNSNHKAILNSKKHKILSVAFSDYLNNKWKWSPNIGLKRL